MKYLIKNAYPLRTERAIELSKAEKNIFRTNDFKGLQSGLYRGCICEYKNYDTL
jgi:hypothetical protein